MPTYEHARAHLNNAICRQCWGTGEVPGRVDPGARATCRDCDGHGALR